MVPFHVQFELTRRQRAGELLPWLPALAASIGFGVGGAYLSAAVTPWFLLLFLLPIIFYRGLFVLLFRLAVHPRLPAELTVDETTLWAQCRGTRRRHRLDDIFQVFRSGDAWTLLFRDNSALVVPLVALTAEQVDYLKSFARRAAAERKAAEHGD